MGSFTLLAVLGSGSSRLSCHHRLPLAAYQAGSILVIWDYTRLGEDSRKFILLQPGQSCSHLFFSKDAEHLLGFWRCNGRPMLAVWRTSNGMKVAEHNLSDVAAASPIWVDYHRETEHLVILHGVSVVSASVFFTDESLSLRPVAMGSLGTAESKLLAVRLINDARHFAVAEADAVHFWSYAGPRSVPQQVLRVDLPKPLRGFEVEGRLAYLLPEQGKLQVMNFQGERVQVAQTSLQPSSFDAKGGTVCVGCEDGSLMLSRNPCPDRWKTWPCPAQLSLDGIPPGIMWLTLAANEDYACVCFEDATHGVIHLSSGQYVALRAGHVGGIGNISMAPLLRAPVSLAGRMLDMERILRTKALAFLSVGDQRRCPLNRRGLGCIAWPKQGPPARGFLERLPDLPLKGFESLPVAGSSGLTGRASFTTAVFHPTACLGSDGSLTGAYAMIAGAEDGSIHLLQAEATSEQVSWRTQRVRPREVFQPEVTQLPGEVKQVFCCHLDVSPCGNFVLASFSDGAVDMLDFPMLSRLTQLQYAQPCPVAKQKGIFVWRATVTQRAYDTNLYVISRAAHPWEVVLHEVYPLGNSFVKAVKLEFALAKVCQAAGGFLTDFCVHPSQLYLVAAAVLPSSDARSILLVYDLWSGELLKSCEIFTSLLVAPRVPLRPSLCMDCSGSYIFCASTPAPMGPLDLQFDRGSPPVGLSGCSDLLHSDCWQKSSAELIAESTSVVCAVDFASGEPCYQASINASCISLGSPWHDPCQLLVGARDGTISVWQPPPSISARIRSLLEESLEVFDKVEGAASRDSGSLSPPLSRVEEAVSFLWATKLQAAIDWSHWGEAAPSDVQPMLPLAPSAPLAPLAPLGSVPSWPTARPEVDVVVQARQQWAESCGQPAPPAPAAPFVGSRGPVQLPGTMQLGQPIGGLGDTRRQLQREEPEIDPVSGLEVFEMPSPTARRPQRLVELSQLATRAPEPAELLGPAPELREEFGTQAEHFQDPVPSTKPSIPRPLERPLERPASVPGLTAIPAAFLLELKPWRRSVKGRPPVPTEDLVKSVISELDRFESCLPDQAPESPRSDAEVVEVAS